MTSVVPRVFGFLSHTRLYVWVFFALIAFLGYQRTKDRTVPLWRLLLLPVIMVVLSVSGMIGAGAAVLPAILAGIAVGGVSGWRLEREGATRRLPGGRVWLRGEWWSLVQVLLIFVVHYSLAVTGAINPTLVADPTVHLVPTFVSSLLSAMISGRLLARLRVYFTSAPAAA